MGYLIKSERFPNTDISQAELQSNTLVDAQKIFVVLDFESTLLSILGGADFDQITFVHFTEIKRVYSLGSSIS